MIHRSYLTVSDYESTTCKVSPSHCQCLNTPYVNGVVLKHRRAFRAERRMRHASAQRHSGHNTIALRAK
jgi:hypothetical protein